jgi:hypothetical protein
MKKGDIIKMCSERYMLTERIEDFGHGESGWVCVDMNTINEKGRDNITAFDCWRVTDKYLEFQIQRGVITVE